MRIFHPQWTALRAIRASRDSLIWPAILRADVDFQRGPGQFPTRWQRFLRNLGGRSGLKTAFPGSAASPAVSPNRPAPESR